MLTTEGFRAWCQRFDLSGDTAEMLSTIRSASPVRKVRGRASNVARRYPSAKMQRSIQFESQHVELWAIYAMERDEQVLEYYEQPIRLPLRYRAMSGRQTTQWHTPDFFVLRTTGGAFEEWKPGAALEALAVSMPHRYERAGDGTWHCPPGEAWARPLGLNYQVRSSAEYHPLYITSGVSFIQTTQGV